MLRLLTAALVSLALVPMPGFSDTPAPMASAARWWDLGHRMVALIAETRLTPHTREAVRSILGGQSLADASVWADNIRQYRHDADPLHYVNIPIGVTTYDSARYCPNRRCIIAAIADDGRVLADPSAPADARAEAVRFLIHFMGDLHQPLHVGDNSDRGGNQRVVYLEGDSTNLHAVWDGKILERAGVTEAAYLTQLRRAMDTLDLAALERGSVVDWAMEGHRISAERAYRLPPDGRLGQAYVDSNRPIIDHAIIAAGVRLGKLLNTTLAGYQPSAATAPVTPGVFADRDAAAHVGQTATVVGTVATVFHSKGGNVYVNFGADYPRQIFTAVALAPLGTWASALDSLPGRRVGVRGEIVSYRGRVEIVLRGADQMVSAP